MDIGEEIGRCLLNGANLKVTSVVDTVGSVDTDKEGTLLATQADALVVLARGDRVGESNARRATCAAGSLVDMRR